MTARTDVEGSRPIPTGKASDQPRPGDEVPPGAPQSGDALCPRCGGSGRLPGDVVCADCEGSGHITALVGDA